MAEQDLAQILGGLGQITRVLQRQSIIQAVKPFAGDPSRFREWIKNIEKHALLTGGDEANKIIIAYQSSSGIVSDFIRRFLDTPGDNRTWVELKRQLGVRFAEVSDEQHAFALLQRTKQSRNESVPVFAERLQTLAVEAYPDGLAGPVQRQLIGFFVDGLEQDGLKMKLMRDNPATFGDAVRIATEEQNLRLKFALRTKGMGVRDIGMGQVRHEPMEVDHLREMRCHRCNRKGHRARDCRIVAEVQQSTVRRQQVECWHCHEFGHIRRDCRKRRRQAQTQQGN